MPLLRGWITGVKFRTQWLDSLSYIHHQHNWYQSSEHGMSVIPAEFGELSVLLLTSLVSMYMRDMSDSGPG